MTALYDRIGRGYDTTRRADPTIVASLRDAIGLDPAGRVLDVGCGTGNYTMALAQSGARVCGIDASAVMLAAARARAPHLGWVQGRAEALPFASAGVDAITCVNAVHHFVDADAAFAEFHRVLAPGGRLAIFTNTSEEVRAFWIARYFPQAVAGSAARCLPAARFSELAAHSGLALVQRIGWRQPEEPVDLFLYSGKHRPGLYLDPAVRAGISTFAQIAEAAEVERGVAQLRADIESGAIAETVRQAAQSASDYSIFVYRRAGRGS